MKWIACYSYTGTELESIIKRTNRSPDIVITNNSGSDFTRWQEVLVMSDRPSEMEYVNYLHYNNIISDYIPTIITLHGWNRIIPDTICNRFSIYNVHPGDVINYPQLIGADPQKKAIKLHLPTTGVIIHQVTAELDQGPIVKQVLNIPINNQTVEQLTSTLRDVSVDMWCEFLSEQGVV